MKRRRENSPPDCFLTLLRPAQDPPIIDTRSAMALRKEGLKSRHLGVRQPEEVAHRSVSSRSLNHAKAATSIGPEPGPSRITLKDNGKIQPKPEGENAFARASGGGIGIRAMGFPRPLGSIWIDPRPGIAKDLPLFACIDLAAPACAGRSQGSPTPGGSQCPLGDGSDGGDEFVYIDHLRTHAARARAQRPESARGVTSVTSVTRTVGAGQRNPVRSSAEWPETHARRFPSERSACSSAATPARQSTGRNARTGQSWS